MGKVIDDVLPKSCALSVMLLHQNKQIVTPMGLEPMALTLHTTTVFTANLLSCLWSGLYLNHILFKLRFIV